MKKYKQILKEQKIKEEKEIKKIKENELIHKATLIYIDNNEYLKITRTLIKVFYTLGIIICFLSMLLIIQKYKISLIFMMIGLITIISTMIKEMNLMDKIKKEIS